MKLEQANKENNIMEIKNAKITDVKLFIEDHDILTFDIFLDLGGACYALGGYALDQAFRINESDDSWKYERKSSPAGLDCMRRIMEVVGVKSWDELKGKYIRYEDNGWGSRVTKIGNIMKDEWIDVDDFMKNYDYEDWIKKFRQ